ncbi:5219_t:CDS:2, partial [Gigaspora rosea]
MVKWKKERDLKVVKDFKYAFVDIEEFEKHDCLSKMRYSVVFFIVLKAVLVYIADLYSMTALLLNDTWTSVKPAISFSISKWIFVGSIIMSFILLFLEMRKARTIVKSDDISFSFTNKIAYRYYTLTSYAHWCFFQEIQDREKIFPDKVAFHVFFEFKGQHQGPQPTIPTLGDDNYLPQYNDQQPKSAFNVSEYPPDKLNYNNATVADQQGYYVQNPNIYQQQRDSTGVNSSRDSSSAPVFQNYNSSRRESISSATGPIYNERSNSP